MTRDEAIRALSGRRFSSELIDSLVALELLKLDEPRPSLSIEDKAARVLSTWGFSRKQIDDCFKALWINDFRIKEREE